MPLDNYILKIKEYLKTVDLNEEEIIMYVYLDLASRFSFDSNFFFGGTKTKKNIYDNAQYIGELNKCFENNKIICRSSAYILEYVLKSLDINIRIIYENDPLKKYQHVLNVITPADNSREYTIDLQTDISNIIYHSFTTNFGKSLTDDKEYIITPAKQKEIHLKLGYITSNNMYTDNYIDTFKIFTSSDMPFIDKINLVLSNIEVVPSLNDNYWERRWYHEKILSELFEERELKNKLFPVEFYQISDDNTKKYNNGFFTYQKNNVYVFYYSKDNYQYECYDLHSFAHKVIDEKIYHNQGIKGLNHELNIIKEKKQLVKKI